MYQIDFRRSIQSTDKESEEAKRCESRFQEAVSCSVFAVVCLLNLLESPWFVSVLPTSLLLINSDNLSNRPGKFI